MTNKWRKIANEVYRPFAERAGLTNLDFSEVAAVSLFQRETFGRGCVTQDNGFAQGKRIVDITVAMWIEDMYPNGDYGPLLLASDLYDDI